LIWELTGTSLTDTEMIRDWIAQNPYELHQLERAMEVG